MQKNSAVTQEKFGEITLSINLIVPQELLLSDNREEAIAEYLNQKLYEDPEFFGGFDEENIKVQRLDID